MLFEETVPACTETTVHLHRDGDEVACLLRGEITFKIGEESQSVGRAPAPSCHAAYHTRGKTLALKTGRVLFLHHPTGAGAFLRNGWAAGRVDLAEANETCRRRGLEIVGPSPF
jgi:hypothetical protein